jgi:peroxiredoxin (alkyl hydroperoxide reductase subunit C)
MKTYILILTLLLFSVESGKPQTTDIAHGPLLFGNAPSFKATSTMGTINFPADYFAKWKIIFSHPADFTPVCTSECLALAALQNDFKKLNTALIVISTDGLNSHLAWIQSMEAMSADSTNSVKIGFPIISDVDFTISKLYGIIQTDSLDSLSRKDIRGVYIIDPDNKIRAFFYYPKTVGRNTEEIKRVLIALQTEDKHDVLIPANWQPGEEVLIHSPSTISDAEKLEGKKDSKLREVAWYMWYKKL